MFESDNITRVLGSASSSHNNLPAHRPIYGYLNLVIRIGGLGVQLARARFTQIGLAPVGLGQLRRQGPLGASFFSKTFF